MGSFHLYCLASIASHVSAQDVFTVEPDFQSHGVWGSVLWNRGLPTCCTAWRWRVIGWGAAWEEV